jgi:hypothetical protein
MSKLTLSVDEAVVKRAKRYAARRGVSVSQLVEQYLELVSRPPAPRAADTPPVLQMLRGAGRGAALDDYRRYLRKKYG